MLRLLSDENFDNYIVRGLMRRLPTIDLIRVVDRRQAGIGRPPKDLLPCRGGIKLTPGRKTCMQPVSKQCQWVVGNRPILLAYR